MCGELVCVCVWVCVCVCVQACTDMSKHPQTRFGPSTQHTRITAHPYTHTLAHACDTKTPNHTHTPTHPHPLTTHLLHRRKTRVGGKRGLGVAVLPDLKSHSSRTFNISSYYREYFSELSAFCGWREREECGAAGDAIEVPRLAEMSSDQNARHCHSFSEVSAPVRLLYKVTI